MNRPAFAMNRAAFAAISSPFTANREWFTRSPRLSDPGGARLDFLSGSHSPRFPPALAIALAGIWWDNPTMATSTADAKRRVVIHAASPGDVFDIQSQGEGRLLLVRLERPKSEPGMSMERVLEAIAAAPLRPKMTWDSLRGMTREP